MNLRIRAIMTMGLALGLGTLAAGQVPQVPAPRPAVQPPKIIYVTQPKPTPTPAPWLPPLPPTVKPPAPWLPPLPPTVKPPAPWLPPLPPTVKPPAPKPVPPTVKPLAPKPGTPPADAQGGYPNNNGNQGLGGGCGGGMGGALGTVMQGLLAKGPKAYNHKPNKLTRDPQEWAPKREAYKDFVTWELAYRAYWDAIAQMRAGGWDDGARGTLKTVDGGYPPTYASDVAAAEVAAREMNEKYVADAKEAGRKQQDEKGANKFFNGKKPPPPPTREPPPPDAGTPEPGAFQWFKKTFHPGPDLPDTMQGRVQP